MPASERTRFATHPSDRRFFSVIGAVATVVILAGFGWTYAPKVAAGRSVLGIIHLHAAVFTGWLALFVVQTRLVSRGRVGLHQRLGLAGAVLAGLMLMLGTAAAVEAGRRGHRGLPGAEFPDAAGFLLFSLLAILAFSILVAAAIAFRRQPQIHKRLMLFALVGTLLPPGLSRLPIIGGHPVAIAAVAVAFFLAGPAYDLVTRRRIHAAYLWGALPVAVTLPPLVARIAATAGWRRIAAWLIQ